MRTHNLEVSFDHPGDEVLSKIFLHFSRGWFKYSLGHSIVHPHSCHFVFERLSDEGLENLKGQFRSFNLENGKFTTIEVVG